MGRPRSHLATVVLALAGAALVGCGDPPPAPPAPPKIPTPTADPSPRPPPTERPLPPIPEDATAHEVSNVLRDALGDDGDLRAAVPALRRLVETHYGVGTNAGGGGARVELLAGAVAMRAAEVARAAVEGPAPDPARARALLEIGTAALAAAEATDAPEAADLARARAWVDLAGPPFDAERVGRTAREAPEEYVLVVTDDFELGETLLSSVLRRWAKGAPVEIVARLTGHVRAGMRREPADEETELASVGKRIAAIGARPAGVLRADDPRIEASGLGPGTSVFLVRPGVMVQASRVLVARCAGRMIDPRVLDDPVRATFPNVQPAPK